jgi:hypothetical protein
MGMYGSTGPTGPTGPVYIMTLDQLTQYHEKTVESERTDKTAMDSIVNPSLSGIQQNLITWASAGFPMEYKVLSVSLICPSPCSDGAGRGIMSYISYLTGSDIMTLTTNFATHFLGIYFSYRISGNTVELYASKIPTA